MIMENSHVQSHSQQPTLSLKDLTTDNITDNVLAINASNPDVRFKYILERAVVHLHEFARETRLSTAEWMAGLLFLTATGQICTDVRQEFILLSDVLGLSILVDSMDHPKPPNSTEGTVLGPFHTHEAEQLPQGAQMSHDTQGEPLLVVCTVKDTNGRPVENCKIDIWEADSTGHYDVQHADHDGPDGRCILQSDAQGVFWFKAIVPVPYPIPHDGPVGRLLKMIGRHPMRPAHMHFMFEKEGYDHLITALYLHDDPYETTDSVFGVKSSLVVKLDTVGDNMAKQYDVAPETRLLKYDFVLVTEDEAVRLRNEKSIRALEKLGRKVKVLNGLPVPDVD